MAVGIPPLENAVSFLGLLIPPSVTGPHPHVVVVVVTSRIMRSDLQVRCVEALSHAPFALPLADPLHKYCSRGKKNGIVYAVDQEAVSQLISAFLEDAIFAAQHGTEPEYPTEQRETKREDMSMTVKAYLLGKEDCHKEIRRFAVDEGVSTSFEYMSRKVMDVFSNLRNVAFQMFYRGESILLSSNVRKMLILMVSPNTFAGSCRRVY